MTTPVADVLERAADRLRTFHYQNADDARWAIETIRALISRLREAEARADALNTLWDTSNRRAVELLEEKRQAEARAERLAGALTEIGKRAAKHDANSPLCEVDTIIRRALSDDDEQEVKRA